MAVFMNELLKMSMRGIVIIAIVMAFRFLLRRLRVGHKYIVGLWIMAFLFFVIPWKISLPVGFWGNTAVLDGIWMAGDVERGENESPLGMNSGNSLDHGEDVNGIRDDTDLHDMGNVGAEGYAGYMFNTENKDAQGSMAGMSEMGNGNSGIAGGSAAQASGMSGAAPETPADSENKDGVMPNETWKSVPVTGKVMDILSVLWLTGLCACVGYMLYSYLRLKKKLMLSIPYKDNIWWAENIDMPIAFGLVFPQVYLPIGLEEENLSYVIAHEEMHIRRKDGLFKMVTYVICLIHWFNPFIWAAYILLGSDLEKACDEEVIRSMEKEKRKEYAYALIHIAAGNGKKKRKVFVAPIGFDQGNLKSRVKNVMKYKYTLPGLGAMVIVVIIALSALFMTEAKDPAESRGTGTLTGQNGDPGTLDGAERNEDLDRNGETGNDGQGNPAEDDGQNGLGENGEQNGNADTAGNVDTLPTFYVEDLDSLMIREPFFIEDYYITNRQAAGNHYYIDENGVLWGTGDNVYGQLGTGTYGFEDKEYYEEPVKIAENVVSVDASENGYFCIYLTAAGDLYGMGSNCGGILLGKGSEVTQYSVWNYQKVTKPVLLMTDVAYAKVGRENIVALQTDGSAYWWGTYSSTTLSRVNNFEDYWRLDEDDANPAKMYVCEPKKIMDDCVYITTGTYMGAAINEAGELYTWGLNLFGQCGMPVTEDDYIREPVKVMDGVKMVWAERMCFNNSEENYTFYVRMSTHYSYNTFIFREDDTLMAAGQNLGDKEKVTELTGDLVETRTHRYEDHFVPVRAVEYSPELNLQLLRELEFGMPIEEAEEILNSSGAGVFLSNVDEVCLCAKYSQYYCNFDSQNRLESIQIQEGGSRDGRFLCDMSLSELQDIIEGAGGELTEETDGDYIYEDRAQHITYIFHIYGDTVISVQEIAMD